MITLDDIRLLWENTTNWLMAITNKIPPGLLTDSSNQLRVTGPVTISSGTVTTITNNVPTVEISSPSTTARMVQVDGQLLTGQLWNQQRQLSTFN